MSCVSKSLEKVDPFGDPDDKIPTNALDDSSQAGEKFYFGAEISRIQTTQDDHYNTGLGNDIVMGKANSFETIEDHGGNDLVLSMGGNDLLISRDGGDFYMLSGDNGDKSVQTVRVYPTHEKDHLFGWKHPEDLRQCVKLLDMRDVTNVELVLDDPWFPDHKYTNEDDFCSELVHGWELGWYWDSWKEGEGNNVDIWFTRETGEATFCLSDEMSECSGQPKLRASEEHCITYWVKCENRDYSTPSTVE